MRFFFSLFVHCLCLVMLFWSSIYALLPQYIQQRVTWTKSSAKQITTSAVPFQSHFSVVQTLPCQKSSQRTTDTLKKTHVLPSKKEKARKTDRTPQNRGAPSCKQNKQPAIGKKGVKMERLSAVQGPLSGTVPQRQNEKISVRFDAPRLSKGHNHDPHLPKPHTKDLRKISSDPRARYGHFVPCANNFPPIYPKDARYKGIEGQAIFRLYMDENGSVRHVACLNDAYPAILKRAAIQALKTWRFKGTIPPHIDVPIIFRMPV